MELLNRIALIVTPKRRFLEWVNRLPDAGNPLTIEDAASLRMVYLAATIVDDTLALSEIIDTYWEEILENSLNDWTHDESLWPANRTPHVFRDWFHVDCVEGVADMDPDEPVTIHELARTRCAVCESGLDSGAIAVLAFADNSVRRMTVPEFDALAASARDDDDDSFPEMSFRCCSETCAQRMEKSLAEAHTQSH